MTGAKRSAGYCSNCQRGVTVVRPSGTGLFGRVRTALTANEDSWVCSKCGQPAQKGFTPPPETKAPEASDTIVPSPNPESDSPRQTTVQADPAELRPPVAEDDHAFTASSAPDDSEASPPSTTAQVMKLPDDPQRPEISKAQCIQCQFTMTYPKKLTGKQVSCPSCAEQFELP